MEPLTAEIDRAIDISNVSPNEEQRECFDSITSCTTGQHVIVGHAGTGKTYLTATIITKLLDSGKTVQVLAPTAAALAVLEKRLDYHRNLQFRTIASCMQSTHDTLSLGDSAPSFPLTSRGLVEFARFMDLLNVDHSGIITAWDTTTDTATVIDCADPSPIVDARLTHIEIDFPTLSARLDALFTGTSPFSPHVATVTRNATANDCATRIAAGWPAFPDAVVVDEFSMVNAEQAEIITTATRNRRALFIGCGDSHQLQPVSGSANPYLRRETAPEGVAVHELTRVMRSDSHIINLADQIRRGTRFNDLAIAGEIERVPDCDPETLVESMPEVFSRADVVLAYRNTTVTTLNRAMRTLHGIEGAIQPGENLVCNANVLTRDGYAFRNGELFTVVDTATERGAREIEVIRRRADRHPQGMLDMFVTLLDSGAIEHVELADARGLVRPAFIWADPTTADPQTHLGLSRALLPLVGNHSTESCLIDVSLAYALTIHKAQGSEWSNVVYLANQRDLDIQATTHAPYTAVTRAKRKLTVLYSR